MKYFLITVSRNPDSNILGLETICVQSESIINFLVVEFELGRTTVILFSKEISKEEWKKWVDSKNLFLERNNQNE
jgi:hypothetical protein